MSRLSDEVGAFLEAAAVSEDDHGASVGSPLDVSNAVLARANRRLDRLEARLADLLEPILDRAAAQAAASFRRVTASALPLTAAATPDVTNLSTMVCVKPTAEQASALAQDGGIDPADLHVTLCYLGEIDGTLEPIAEALRPVAAEHAPLQGVVGGVGVFAPNEEGVGPAILLPDVPGLVELRLAVSEALAGAEIDYGRDHGFEAHVTVRYYSPGDEAAFADLPFLEPLSFGALYLVRGDVVEYEFPLVGRPPVTAAAGDPPGWMPPTGDELVDVEALVRQLRTKTDPVRRALVEQAMTPTLKAAGLDFDVTNPFVERVLGQTGQHVRGIAETTRVNVMRIIRSSAEQGLTVPDTAAAIRQGMRDATAGRARTIARTELAGAVNGGSLAATKIVAQALGTEYMKRWLTAAGAPHPRHEEYDGLDGQTVGLDENFDVGGSPLEFPGDPGGEPGETINCRCALIYLEAGQHADGEGG